MELFEEKLVRNAIRLSWVVLSLVIIMVFSGIGLCVWQTKDPGTNFSLLGLKLSSGEVGLFVIALAITMFSMQKRFFEMLVDPKKILAIGSHISKAKQKLSDSKKIIELDTPLPNESASQKEQSLSSRAETRNQNLRARNILVRVIFQIGVSLVILLLSLVILLDPHSDVTTAKIACGFLGATVGYWMR